MSAVIGQVSQQSGNFVRIDVKGNEHPLKAGDKIHKGDKVLSKGGEQLIVTLDNDETLTLDQQTSLVFDASVIGDELFAKEDVSIDEFSIDALLETGPVDADAVAETAAGAQANEGYVSGATGVDRLGQSGDAKADTSTLENPEDNQGPNFNAYDAMTFAAVDTPSPSGTSSGDLPQNPVPDESTPPIEIVGSSDDDILTGSGSDDIISGEAGDDTLTGEAGNDIIEGGEGDDLILGNSGDDTLLGNDGDDTIEGGNGDDLIQGGNGDDTVSGNAGEDLIQGGDGDDTLYGNEGDDTLNGGDGSDILEGGDGDDVLLGGDGNDVILGNDGDDILIGGEGDDTIVGGSGDDIIQAGAGDDIIMAGEGNDIIDGGDGEDTLILNGSRDDYTVIENSDGTTVIIDNRNNAPDGTIVVENVETFQFDDQTLSSSDLVDSNRQENSDADAALDAATQSLTNAQNSINEINELIDTVITAQATLDLNNPSDLADAEAELDALLQSSQDSLDSANEALQDAQDALTAAQDALDAALENGESTDEETERLQEVEALLTNAQDLVNEANATLETTQEMIQDLESQTIEPTLDMPTDAPITDATPNLSGNAEAGSTVTITIDGVIMGSVTANDEGLWNYETDVLSEGEHTITLSSSDEEGNTASSDPISITIDAQADAPNLEITIVSVDEVTIETPDSNGHHGWFGSHGCGSEEQEVYDYTINIDASLNDMNETLSDLTLTLPEGVILFDCNGNLIEQNSDGTYTVDPSLEENSELVMRSDELLDTDELESITGEISSINSDDQTATTQAGAQVDESVTPSPSTDDIDFTHIGDFDGHHHGGHHKGHHEDYDTDTLTDLSDLFPGAHHHTIFGDDQNNGNPEPTGSSREEGSPASPSHNNYTLDHEPLKIDISTHIDDL